MALLAGAKAARGSANALWSLVDALCFTDCAGEPAAEAKKLAPPDAALQRKKEAEVREVYSARIAAAATAPQKLALADTLLRKAKETRNDPAGKYVLLQSAAQEAKEKP